MCSKMNCLALPSGWFLSRVEISNHSESEARTHQWIFQLPIFPSPETTRNIGTNRTQQKVSFTGMAVYLRSWDQGILCRVQALQSTQITSSYRHLSVDANRCCSKLTWRFGGEGFGKARKVPRTSALEISQTSESSELLYHFQHFQHFQLHVLLPVIVLDF